MTNRPPFWKKIISYLTELHIESAPSDINPHLYVSLNRGRYQLCTANAIYSYEDLYDNYSEAFKKIEIDKRKVENVLILGFGLGSIPFMLEKTFHKKYHYTAVEIDESVIYLATKYALPEINSSIQMICTDAFAYVMQCQEQFDLVCMDVFLDDLVPEEFEAEDFLKNLKRLIAKDGLLLFNRLANTPEDLKATQTFFKEKFQPVFPDGRYLEVRGNWMLLDK